jgi:tetratricopeptide (TPR) repeat protein
MKKDLTILFMLVLSFKSFSQTTADDFIDNGIKSYQSGNIKEAIVHFSQAIKVDKKNVNGHYYRGQMNLFNGDIDNAIVDFKNSISLRDTLFQAFQYLGICYLNKRDTNEALIFFDKSLKINPKYFDALQNKAIIYIGKLKVKEAIILVDEALKINFNNPLSNFQKGYLLLKLDDSKNASLFFEKSESLGYKSDVLYNCLAICYLGNENYSKALIMSNNAISLNNAIGGYYINKALILMNMGLKDMSKDTFRKAIELGEILSEEQKKIYNGL